MSLLLETHKNDIPSSYMALFPHLLQPVLWERTGNIPALVRLLQAFLERGSNTIASAAADKIVSQISRGSRGGRFYILLKMNLIVVVENVNVCFIRTVYPLVIMSMVVENKKN